MPQNRALIVDDSRTAQARLKKMLERYDLEVDTVFSAEEAFGYLSYRHPAVVFLDHHMEGMDGLDALKVIKSNPDTAIIPVIMYTSEQGDLYVGQARALGALDILSKEIIKPASLEKVLASLGIKPMLGVSAANEPVAIAANSERGEVARFKTRQTTAEGDGSEATHQALDQVQRQISRLFELHITKVRQEIEDSSQAVMRRLSRELQQRPPPKIPESDTPVVLEAPLESSERNRGLMLMMALLLLAVAFAGYHLYINNRHQSIATEQLGALTERVRAQESLISRLFERVGSTSDAEQTARNFADKQVLLDALGWAVNVDNQVPFAELPLNNERVYILSELVSLLKAANFAGTVFMDTHLGNYCVVEGPRGDWVLPEPKTSISDCTLMSSVAAEVPISEQLTVNFLNYLNTTPALTEGKINVELSTHNYSTPRFSYPSRSAATTAGEWNAIAQKNSLVTLMFSAD